MHSFGYRANALLTFAVTILAFICAIASFSDNFSNQTPSAQIQILNINWFQKQPHGNDEVFAFVAAEYETSKNSLNQVSLWDAIIPEKEEANFWIQISNKYRFIDQGHNLRGKDFNLTLHWHVMPKTGKMFADKIVMSGYRLPNANMEVKARAPGKIILAGEHAVVHGSTAVAAAIDLYTYVTLRLPLHSDESNDRLTLQLKDLSLEFTWSVSRLKEGIAYDSSNVSPSTPASCSSQTLKSIAVLVEEQNIPEAKIQLSSGISTFLWIYTSILGRKNHPWEAFRDRQHRQCIRSVSTLKTSKTLSSDENHLCVFVVVAGNMIKFCSGEITRLKSNMPLRMLITNTKVGRNTKALVSGVSERAVRHPEAMNSVFNAVDSISKEVAAIIQTKDEISVTEKEESVKELMEMNQGLLESMGVSHSSIDTVIQTTLKHKLASKLTGAGGGGCVLTLLPTLVSGTVVEKVVEELESSGFQCFTASIGGKGAEICF
ncbi:hypothetical protein IGI04_008325 [Brassica rapa subsp. trilocularis]|uniref:GHMP kinase C-terminal domain-containing protein n=1 Tax=Brassica rapa subsp. trilocularis TaxID=1813537 RepID=A0ABQ7NMA9_BRACM|nr:hypothetical protein IGI04_008325 [Brassica rapa subsp. trilocularis]